MVEYELKIIEEYASRLYAQSKKTPMLYFLIGVGLGIIIFLGIGESLTRGFDALIVSIGALVGGVMGYGAGQSKSFEQKLQAQMALCQAKIEINTRR